MGRGGGGMWHGPMGSVGGVTRTYGLHNHFGQDKPEGPPPGITWGQVGRIMGYFRPYKGSWGLIFACVLVAAGVGVLPPLCVARIVDVAIPRGDGWMLGWLSLAILGLAVGGGLVGVLQQTLMSKVAQGIMCDLRKELFGHLQKMSLRFYTMTRSGEIVSRINNDVGMVQGAGTSTVVTIVSNVATLTAALTVMVSMNWVLTLLATAVVPAFYLPSRVVGGIRRRLSIQTAESQARMQGFLTERLHVGGAMLMQIYGQREADAREFAGTAAAVRDLNIRQAVAGRWLFMILSAFSAMGPAVVYWYGGVQVVRERMQIGEVIAFAALLVMLYRPLMQLASVYVDLQGMVGVFERIFAYLDMPVEVADPAAPEVDPPLRREDATQGRRGRTKGRVGFEGVSFAYPRVKGFEAVMGLAGAGNGSGNGNGTEGVEEKRWALRGVNFSMEPGQRVALVGPSGAGKTTVTYLLPRFYDPDEGRITLDGVDVREMQQEELRGQIGMVTQETFVFHESVRTNLLYARPGATEGEMIEACRAANIHELIAGLPEGYDTIVGERGFRLSGGEKQRLSIARALLKDPAILILDEATSSLDATSEYLIQEALEKLLVGRTSLIIAHRLSTILSADKIVVLEQGRVVEEGRHEALVERGGLYAELFRKQFERVLGQGVGRE
ncbi:MAG: ABC transporter ATP-binding protein [Phycisphaeraceae bacterium]|nr:ABC transporter ATP-binding protein [Phycisphaeraceae bacterium]